MPYTVPPIPRANKKTPPAQGQRSVSVNSGNYLPAKKVLLGQALFAGGKRVLDYVHM